MYSIFKKVQKLENIEKNYLFNVNFIYCSIIGMSINLSQYLALILDIVRIYYCIFLSKIFDNVHCFSEIKKNIYFNNHQKFENN